MLKVSLIKTVSHFFLQHVKTESHVLVEHQMYFVTIVIFYSYSGHKITF